MSRIMERSGGMDLNRLHELLRETTSTFRKGQEVEEREVGGIRVVEVYAMPHESEAPESIEKVDVHFLTVGVNKPMADAIREELAGILDGYPRPDRLAGGPSYIELGAEIGSQDAALRLFAVGKVLGLWDVITPKSMGITGPMADQLAGSGMVMITGYTPKQP